MKINIKYLIFSEDQKDSVNFIVNLNVIRDEGHGVDEKRFQQRYTLII